MCGQNEQNAYSEFLSAFDSPDELAEKLARQGYRGYQPDESTSDSDQSTEDDSVGSWSSSDGTPYENASPEVARELDALGALASELTRAGIPVQVEVLTDENGVTAVAFMVG